MSDQQQTVPTPTEADMQVDLLATLEASQSWLHQYVVLNGKQRLADYVARTQAAVRRAMHAEAENARLKQKITNMEGDL